MDRKRISYRLSLRVFLICTLFGLIGSTVIFLTEYRLILTDQQELLKEIGSSYFREIENELLRKIESAELASLKISETLSGRAGRSANIVRGANGEYRSDDLTSGAFSPSTEPLTQQLLDRYEKTEEIWNLFSPLLLKDFLSFWIITSENFIRISPAAEAMKIDSGKNLLEDFRYRSAMPQFNPDRIPFWDTIRYDSAKRTWRTSLVYPFYENNAFSGVTGFDLSLNSILTHIDTLESESYGFQFLIFDRNNNIVHHPLYSKNIPGKLNPVGELLNISYLENDDLASFISDFNGGTYKFKTLLSYKDRGYTNIGISFPLSLLDWRLVVYRPLKELNKPATSMAWKIYLLTMLISFLLAYSIQRAAASLLTNRISHITNGLIRYEKEGIFWINDDKNDELSNLIKKIKDMGETISSQMNDLAKAHGELAEILESSTMIFIISTDRDGIIREYNKGAELILGYERSEMIGINTPAIFHNETEIIERGAELSELYGEKIEGFQVFVYKPLKDGSEVREWTCRRKDGRNILIKLRVTPVIGKEGTVRGYLGMGVDVTENQKQEEKLKEMREYLISILNSISSPILAVDDNLEIVKWNEAALSEFGEEKRSLYGRHVTEILSTFARDMEIIESAVREKRFKSVYKRKVIQNGQVSFWNILIYPLIGDDRMGAVIHIENVTEAVRIEDMLIQNEKMLSVGGLAAGMAHEINNPLAGIMQTLDVMARRLLSLEKLKGNLQAAELTGLQPEKLYAYLEKRNIPAMISRMRESGHRISDIVDNMLSFSRNSRGRSSVHNPVELIQSSINLARNEFSLDKKYDFKHIGIDLKCDESLPMIPCEKNKIQQVLLNIFQNGAQAMTDGGTENPEFTISCRYNENTKKIEIKIKDNGPGIPEEIRKRIFEPFFTTRNEGDGTGLGLSLSYFIITENHSGDLSVESSPGEGTTFTIALPVSL